MPSTQVLKGPMRKQSTSKRGSMQECTFLGAPPTTAARHTWSTVLDLPALQRRKGHVRVQRRAQLSVGARLQPQVPCDLYVTFTCRLLAHHQNSVTAQLVPLAQVIHTTFEDECNLMALWLLFRG